MLISSAPGPRHHGKCVSKKIEKEKMEARKRESH
jgi:hypothetical protein